jgi:hypothetical protein
MMDLQLIYKYKGISPPILYTNTRQYLSYLSRSFRDGSSERRVTYGRTTRSIGIFAALDLKSLAPVLPLNPETPQP